MSSVHFGTHVYSFKIQEKLYGSHFILCMCTYDAAMCGFTGHVDKYYDL